MGQVTQTGAAVFFRDGDAEQAHVAELAPHVGGEQVVLVDLRGARRQFSGDEGLDLVAEHVDGFAQGEVQGRITHAGTFYLFLDQGVVSALIAGKPAPTSSECTEHCGSWLASDGAYNLYVNVNLPPDAVNLAMTFTLT
ncbi:hypothetical protein D9M71_389720 [compost metagenome]